MSARAVVLGLALLGVAGSVSGEPPQVIVAEATAVSFPLTLEALGTTRANESVEIRPGISQLVTAIGFEEGQVVEKGHVLVELEDTEALAAVASARAALVISQGQERRARELFKTRSISEAELEQRTAQRDADRAALEAAQARLADSRIRAPFEGRVGLRRISVGSWVTPETVVTTLDDTDPVKVDFDVPERALARLREGLSLSARSVAWPEVRFEGEVATVDTRVDPVSRSVTVRAVVPNPEGRLRPGMFLTVELLKEEVSALVVPEQAVVPEQSRQFVLVVGAEGRVEKREIRTGRRRPGQVEVVDGLRAGERVVAEGTQKVRPGDPVEVVGEVAVASSDAP